MRVFLDFEASSLGERSYPIEVAWVFEDGRSESFLIRPAPSWTDWDSAAEAVHHIKRNELEAKGTPHDQVARRMVETLSSHLLHASAPSWDGKWLSTLLRAAGLPRHSLRLRDTDDAIAGSVRELLQPLLAAAQLDMAARAILAQVRRAAEVQPPRHRALADAEKERWKWLEALRLARAERERLDRRSGTTAEPDL